MNGIAFGQYYPAKSILHKLDPRMKIILALLYIVTSFLCTNVFSFLLLLLSAVFLILVSRIPMRIIYKSLKAIIFILIFTAVLNIFWTSDTENAPLFSWWIINIYKSGLYNAAFIVIRIISMIIGTGLFLTYTTTPIQLTDGLEQLLAPLKIIRVPVHEFSMMMTIALRFIPTLIEETDKIMNAQKARGADFNSGGLVKRAKALLPVLIPLFASSFRRAGELATAMECRCYRGDKGRTRMTQLHYKPVDLVLFLTMLAFGAGVILINVYLFNFLNFLT